MSTSNNSNMLRIGELVPGKLVPGKRYIIINEYGENNGIFVNYTNTIKEYSVEFTHVNRMRDINEETELPYFRFPAKSLFYAYDN
jgi:hypothetical protein